MKIDRDFFLYKYRIVIAKTIMVNPAFPVNELFP